MEPADRRDAVPSSRDRSKARFRNREEIPVLPGLLNNNKILKAYDRGSWLLGDRQKAKEAVARAVSILRETCACQVENKQRTARYKGDEQRAGYRAYLNTEQTFEHLVMIQLEKEEKRQEEGGFGLGELDRIKRFVKHSINVILSHNSYWATVWQCRILCSHTPKEVGRLYDVIAPNRAATKGDSECSRVRKSFLKSIAKRFDVEIDDVIGDDPHILRRSDSRLGLVKESLARFRPSHNSLVVPKGFRWISGSRPLVRYNEDDPRGDEHIEVDRIGILFTLSNFNRVAASQDLKHFDESVRNLKLWTCKAKKSGRKCHE